MREPGVGSSCRLSAPIEGEIEPGVLPKLIVLLGARAVGRGKAKNVTRWQMGKTIVWNQVRQRQERSRAKGEKPRRRRRERVGERVVRERGKESLVRERVIRKTQQVPRRK